MSTVTVFTIGHSTHPIEEFINILQTYNIDCLVDVRTVPGSRHNPQFGQSALEHSLEHVGIHYLWMKELGGLRHTPKDAASINGAWRNKSFRNYADYMQTPEFSDGVDQLIAVAKNKQVVIMCAEAVPWRCHRSLIGDALLSRGVEVQDIFTESTVKPHQLTSFARVEGDRVWYPA